MRVAKDEVEPGMRDAGEMGMRGECELRVERVGGARGSGRMDAL